MPFGSLVPHCVILICAGVVCGCGKPASDLPVCYPVSGTVLVDGTPAVRAVVCFYPVSPQHGGQEYVGQTLTDDNGEFRMTTFSSGDGALKGEYVVTVVAPWEIRRSQDVAVPDLLNGLFASREKSPLKVTVDEQPLALEPFDLKSK